MLVDLGVPVQTVALVTAQERPPPPGKGPEFGKASPIGLVVILVLLIATALLVRSMSKHLRRLPASFDDPPTASSAASTGDEQADGATVPDDAAPRGAGSEDPTRGA